MKIVAIQENINKSSMPYRMIKLYRTHGIEVKILTLQSSIVDNDIVVVKANIIEKIKRRISISAKLKEMNANNQKILSGIPFSIIADDGIDLSKHKLIKDADIIQIHWLGSRFLSPKNVKKLVQLEKPIIFVNHDSSHFTGGCHVRLGCEKFINGCGQCKEILSENENDITTKILHDKLLRNINTENVYVVSPSNWMNENAKKSQVFMDCKCFRIPNPVDTNFFKVLDKDTIRKKYSIKSEEKVLLFGAVNAVSVPYKGYSYLVEAIEIFSKNKDIKDVRIVIFGSDSGEGSISGIPVKYLGKLGEKEMVEAYSLADVYIFPSIDDNFPGTVLEASSCELPVVAFMTGGVTDIVENKTTGYVAKYKDSNDLAEGISWVLDNNDNNCLGKEARKKMQKEYDSEVIAGISKEFFSNVFK